MSPRPYLLKHTAQQLAANITALQHKVDVNTLAEEASDRLERNEIGRVALETPRPIFFNAYSSNRWTGSFILIDPISNTTVAAGMIQERRREKGAERAAQAKLLELEFNASLNAEDELAARQICAVLAERGILPKTDRYSEGEGI